MVAAAAADYLALTASRSALPLVTGSLATQIKLFFREAALHTRRPVALPHLDKNIPRISLTRRRANDAAAPPALRR